MNLTPKISVIVSIYTHLDNLYLILLGLAEQTFKNFEVIVSEDNDSPKTIKFLDEAREQFDFQIKHVSQEDIGFRKTKILNKAVLESSGEYLVFLDGDCIPHKKLLESYSKFLTNNTVCMGRRCFLDEYLTNKVIEKRSLKPINILNIILHSHHLDHVFYVPNAKPGDSNRRIEGCNWGVSKINLLEINGFDEDYVKAGVGEDHDVDWRLRKKGLTFLNIKRSVIVYHLAHKAHYDRATLDYVEQQEREKTALGFIACKNGINKLG